MRLRNDGHWPKQQQQQQRLAYFFSIHCSIYDSFLIMHVNMKSLSGNIWLQGANTFQSFEKVLFMKFQMIILPLVLLWFICALSKWFTRAKILFGGLQRTTNQPHVNYELCTFTLEKKHPDKHRLIGNI